MMQLGVSTSAVGVRRMHPKSSGTRRMQKLDACRVAYREQLSGGFDHLVAFGFAEALDLLQRLPSHHQQAVHSVEASFLGLLHVAGVHPHLAQPLQRYERRLLRARTCMAHVGRLSPPPQPARINKMYDLATGGKRLRTSSSSAAYSSAAIGAVFSASAVAAAEAGAAVRGGMTTAERRSAQANDMHAMSAESTTGGCAWSEVLVRHSLARRGVSYVAGTIHAG